MSDCKKCRYKGWPCESRRSNCAIPCGDYEVEKMSMDEPTDGPMKPTCQHEAVQFLAQEDGSWGKNVKCLDCGMVRMLGDWKEVEG